MNSLETLLKKQEEKEKKRLELVKNEPLKHFQNRGNPYSPAERGWYYCSSKDTKQLKKDAWVNYWFLQTRASPWSKDWRPSGGEGVSKKRCCSRVDAWAHFARKFGWINDSQATYRIVGRK